MEQVLGEISGVEHIYSASQPGLAVLGVQFKVGEHAHRSDRTTLQRDLFEPGLASSELRESCRP